LRGRAQFSVASAILEKEAEPIRTLQPLTTPAFERVVNTCLQKNPEERFQSARDVRLELKWIAETPVREAKKSEEPAGKKRFAFLPWALTGALLIAGGVGAWRYWRSGASGMPTYKQLTFERGFVHAARFAADGRSVYYSAEWSEQPLQIYATVDGIAESRGLN
jgi:hypothetical protein